MSALGDRREALRSEPVRIPEAIPEAARSRWCFFSPGERSLRVLEGDSRTSGGAEAQVAHLAAALAAQGHAVSLIYGDGHCARPPETRAGVLCLDAAPAWRRPRSLAAFWRVLRVQAPDVLYARLPSDFLALLGLAARSRPGGRFVYALAHDLHTRGWTAYDHRRWFHGPAHALGLRAAHRIAVQHAAQRDALAPALRRRAMLVPNILRSVRAGPRDLDAARHDIVWVAKIRPEKRLDRLLDLAEARPSLGIAVVGGYDPLMPPDLRAGLERRAAALPNLRMLGDMRAEAVLEVIGASRVLVNTSDAEGFPNTMLEAWSAGVPVVSLSVDPGGVIAREGLGLVSGGTDALARDAEALVRDAALNRRCGLRGLDYVRTRHARDVVCESLRRCAVGSP
ncbi:glycosyltransferase family 4 protein [Methylobacterium symbioticum]|uniref:Glycosyltransferase subfamily 4-like N-terminal domain-containing protein n=1 Tax=Methylobacterium symbioticum TaxID=2584084 RepID=A0A509ECN9_9HYPH|nr:glycosyltransferase family 4 protein [Methylobacterium symbioticum]VUD72027.1 hypothetical protein MET9862_02621 [Methylobacterium symbioticum]